MMTKINRGNEHWGAPECLIGSWRYIRSVRLPCGPEEGYIGRHQNFIFGFWEYQPKVQREPVVCANHLLVMMVDDVTSWFVHHARVL